METVLGNPGSVCTDTREIKSWICLSDTLAVRTEGENMNPALYTPGQGAGTVSRGTAKSEKIIYCVPYDLTLDGHYCADGYVVITKKTPAASGRRTDKGINCAGTGLGDPGVFSNRQQAACRPA